MQPNDGMTIAPAEAIDYYDSRSIDLNSPITALEAWNLIMSEPLPLLSAAFWVRDAVSAMFGVSKIGGFSNGVRESVAAGDKLDFFLVENVTPELLVLTARDRHLDVMTCLSVDGTVVTITASVITHNWFGRAYMLPVGPAHKLIVSAMLRRLAEKVASRQPLATV